jgi:hypothetical protein
VGFPTNNNIGENNKTDSAEIHNVENKTIGNNTTAFDCPRRSMVTNRQTVDSQLDYFSAMIDELEQHTRLTQVARRFR